MVNETFKCFSDMFQIIRQIDWKIIQMSNNVLKIGITRHFTLKGVDMITNINDGRSFICFYLEIFQSQYKNQ